MRVKKEGILYSFILSFIISIMSFTVAFAPVKAADGNAYSWAKNGSNAWQQRDRKSVV